MENFSVQRRDIRRAFSKARFFAVDKRIAAEPGEALRRAVENLSSAGVETVFFDKAREVETGEWAVFLAFGADECPLAGKSVFLAAPASAPLEVKMRCAYISSLDGESAVLELTDLIVNAKKS